MSYINRYGYKPTPIFKTATDEFVGESGDIKELLFGVELEIDCGCDPEETAEDLVDACEDIYCKHDGSLGDEGIEIVSHPATLEYHCNKLGWDRITDIARDHDYVSQQANTCGLHIHVGRLQFGTSDKIRKEVAAKVVILVSRFWDEMVKFSRRRNSQLNEWACKPMDGWPEGKYEMIDDALFTEDNGRYQAVNLTNCSTIEFRLYNGTLNSDTIKASLQLTSNIVKYAMTYDLDDVIASQWIDVAQYEHYPELDSYLCDRGLTLVPVMPPITFKYNDRSEYENYLEERYERTKKLIMDDAIDAAVERGYAVCLDPNTTYEVGDRVVIVNHDGDCVDSLDGAEGFMATINSLYEENHSFFAELRFDELNFWRWHSSRDGNDHNPRYYSVHRENIRRCVESAA